MNMKRHLLVLAAVLMTVSAFAQDQQVRFFSHRGGRMEYDENTISAFEASYKAGYRGYETDIRMTKDGKLVILHDSNLTRTTDTEGVVEQMTEAQIRKAYTKKGHKVMFLDELMDWLDSKGDVTYVEFELKTNPIELYPEDRLREYCDKLYERVMRNKPAGATYLFTSSDYRGLRYLQQKHPGVGMLLITGKPCNDETIALCKAMGINRLGATMDGTSRAAVKKAHEQGLIVSLWPGQSTADAMLGVYLGADFLCTDIPVEVMNFMKTKAPWVKAVF
ncbi:MAG: glycerophosphodiester phosphodiesterase [Bacteroidales bacterium]|nr:glycerophosphodiester phosphodiesterase [Bacteroidales bacterium]